jgi:hypothetical protein
LAGRDGEAVAEIFCVECGAVIAYVMTGDVTQILNQMASEQSVKNAAYVNLRGEGIGSTFES